MSDSNDLEARLTEIEIQLSHLSRLYEQLNQVVTQQALEFERKSRWIDKLNQEVKLLRERPLESEDPLDERPPHY